MSKARQWTLGLVVAMLLVVIAGWQLGISPIASQISLANSQAATIEASNATTQSKLATLKIQYAGIGKLQSKLDKLRLSVPEQAAAASFLSEITALGAATGVSIESVTLADATVYQSAGTSSGAAATTATTTATPTASAAPVAGVGSAGTSVSSNGLVAIQVTVSATGAYAAVQEFIGLVQTGSRLFVSNQVSFDGSSTAGTSGSASTVLSGNIFTLQGTSDQTTGTGSANGSTSTPTPYPTLTPTPTPTPTSSTKSGTSGTSGTSTTNNQPTPTPTPTPTTGS